MGVLNKLVPGSSKNVTAATAPPSKSVTKSSSSKRVTAPSEFVSPGESAPLRQEERQAAVTEYLASVDSPTIFTTFMFFYFGFFGLVLTIYPYAFAADGLPFTNPMAYWTTITNEMAFIFRIAGAAFLTLVIGPFLDDISGIKEAGVLMKAFTWQMAVINSLVFVVFLYYTLWAPLDTAVPLMFMCQTFLCALLFGWSLIEVSDASLLFKYTTFSTIYYGFFSLALISVPNLLFGPPSPFKYWESWPTIAVMTARFLGSVLICVMIGGYYLFGRFGFKGFGKMCTTWNCLVGALFIVPAFFGQGSAVANMWQIQLVLQVPIIVIGLYLEISGATGEWKVASMRPSKCGANCETFNLVAFIWLFGFIPIMFTDPNMVMGPEPITGMPMFLESIEETGKFFGMSWAVAVLVLILGPYVYGFSHVDVAKQITANFLLFCFIFGLYLLLYPALFNPVTMIPLASVNLLFFCFGLYTVLTAGTASTMV